MRKRSTKEILQLVEVSDTDPLSLSGSGDVPSKKPKTPQERRAEREKEVADERKKDSGRKDRITTARVDKLKASADLDRTREGEIKQDSQRKAELAKAQGRKRNLETQDAIVQSRAIQAAKIRGDYKGKKPKLEKITRKDGSATATGKAAANLVKTGASLVRKTAAIPANIAKQKAKAKLGRMEMDYGRAPDSGTLRQKVGYSARKAGESARKTAVNIRRKSGQGIYKVGSAMSKVGNKISGNPVKTTRPSTAVQGPSQQGAVKKIRRFKGQVMQDHYNYNEDFIREAEKNDKKKKETIDVMKGTNKVEVNPKMQAEAKKMTKKQIKKRDEIADAISTRDMNKRYGDKNVKYAIATKLAMKKEDVTLQDANGNDFVQIVDLIKPEPLVKARSVQEISECWKTHKQVGYKKKGGRMVPNCVPKNEEVELGEMINNPIKRIMKTRQQKQKYGMSGQNMSDVKKVAKKTGGNLSAIKNERNKQITGDPRGTTKNSVQTRKNLVHTQRKLDKFISKSEKDKVPVQLGYVPKGLEKYSTHAIKRKYNPEKGMETTTKFSKKTYPSKEGINDEYIPEAKMPVKGLMKLAATVAANKKKRKNALQIQKFIGEETPDAISGKDLKRISALSGKKTRFGDGPEGTAKRKAALEKKRGMKLDDHPQFKTEGKGSNPNKRYIGDPDVTSKKQFTKTGAIGVEITNPDEEQGIQQRRDAQKRAREEKRKRIEQNKENRRRQREGDNTDT